MNYEIQFLATANSNNAFSQTNSTDSNLVFSQHPLFPKTFYFQIRSQNGFGWSSFSLPYRFSTNPYPFFMSLFFLFVILLCIFCFLVSTINLALYAKKNRDFAEISAGHSVKSLLKAYLWWSFFGLFGAHRFYLYGTSPHFCDWNRSGFLLLLLFWTPIGWIIWILVINQYHIHTFFF